MAAVKTQPHCGITLQFHWVFNDCGSRDHSRFLDVLTATGKYPLHPRLQYSIVRHPLNAGKIDVLW